MRYSTMFLLICLLLTGLCQADVVIVDANGSADYTAIQDAIDESGSGDTIEVRPGVYYESLNFYGKAITITGSDRGLPKWWEKAGFGRMCSTVWRFPA